MHADRRDETLYQMRGATDTVVVQSHDGESRRSAIQLQIVQQEVQRAPIREEEDIHQSTQQSLPRCQSENSICVQAPLLRGASRELSPRSPALAQGALGLPLHQPSSEASLTNSRRHALRLHAGGLDRAAGAVRLSMRVLQEH